MDKKKEQKEFKQLWRAFSLLTGLGIYIAVIIFICLYIGGLADDFFELNGKGRLFGIILGFPVAFYSIYRQLKNGYF